MNPTVPTQLQRPVKPSWLQPNQTAGRRLINFGKDVIDKTGKGMSMINQGIDNVAGLPGRIATGFNKNVPTGFSDQVGQATEQTTGNRMLGNVAGFAAGMAIPVPGGYTTSAVDAATKAPRVLSKIPGLTEKGYQEIIKYIDHTEGINKLTGKAAQDLKYNAQVLAERLGLDSTGGDMKLANKLRAHLDMQGGSADKIVKEKPVVPKPVAKAKIVPDQTAVLGSYLDHVYGIKKLSPEKLDYANYHVEALAKKLGVDPQDKYTTAMKIGEYLDSLPRGSRSLTP